MNNDPLPLLITEIVNLTINVIFFVLFTLRFITLRAFSKTNRYKDYFPKLRILFCFIYIVLSISFFVSNILTGRVRINDSIQLALGGIGQLINSIILIIQLFVLRLQLLKEQPYTIAHIIYFIYLAIISCIRLVFAAINIPQQTTFGVLIIESLFMADSLLQLLYWFVKRQSLPQFKLPTDSEIDQVRNEADTIIPRIDKRMNSYMKETFPYIIPTVSVQHGKIRIILQKLRINHSRGEQTNETNIKIVQERLTANHKQIKDVFIDDILSQNQIISVAHYTTEQIKSFYVLCGQFPLRKKLQFDNTPLQKLAKQFQLFLQELFADQHLYQQKILKYLKVSSTIIDQYNKIVEKLSNSIKDDGDMDSILGIKLQDDKNAIYFSIIIFKHLWVCDHFQYYIKIVGKTSSKASYPYRRYSQFEQFHNNLKSVLKSINKEVELPYLPKKHLFHWNQDQEAKIRRNELQRYLKLLYNDHNIIQIPEIKEILFSFLEIDQLHINAKFQNQFYEDLEVIKGQVSKALIKNEYVTFYEFKIFKKGIQLLSILKRFREFQELHNQLLRWMYNIKITYKTINLPEKIYYRSETERHQKLRVYLQNVVNIRDIGNVYAINSFFNIYGNETERLSDISIVPSSRKNITSKSVYNTSYVIRDVFELVERHINQPARRDSQNSSRRFSKIMDNLGEDQYDQQ